MIRTAIVDDTAALVQLMTQLGYPDTEVFMEEHITKLVQHPDHDLWVYILEGAVAGCISVHYIPQLGLGSSTAIISYLAVVEDGRSKGIGQQLKEHAVQRAMERHCDRIQLHCSLHRVRAHRFYERQGYVESPKYFSKEISNFPAN